jgi:hypothetical protein
MNGANAATQMASHDVVGLPDHLAWAISIAILLSLVLGYIEIVSKAEKPFAPVSSPSPSFMSFC